MFEIGTLKNSSLNRNLINIIIGYDKDNLFLYEYFHLLMGYEPPNRISYNRILFYTQPEVNVSGLKRWWEDVICSR